MPDLIFTNTSDANDTIERLGQTLPYTLTSADGATPGATYSTEVFEVSVTTMTIPAEAPEAFAVGDWSIAVPGNTGELDVTIASIPFNNGTAITGIQYRVDAGTWTDIGGTTAGTYTISGLTDDVEVAVDLRAENSVGFGPDSDDKLATPTASGSDPGTIMGAAIVDWFNMTSAANLRQTNAGATAVAGGDPVGTILGQEGTLNLLSPANDTTRPTFNASGFVQWDGTNDRMRNALTRSGAYYIAMRVRLPSVLAGNGYMCIFSGDESGNWWLNFDAIRAQGSNNFVEMEGMANFLTVSRATWHTIEWIVDTDLRTISLNGGTSGTDFGTDTGSFTPASSGFINIGAAIDPNQWAEMDIAGMAISDAVPTSQQRIDMRAWCDGLAS